MCPCSPRRLRKAGVSSSSACASSIAKATSVTGGLLLRRCPWRRGSSNCRPWSGRCGGSSWSRSSKACSKMLDGLDLKLRVGAEPVHPLAAVPPKDLIGKAHPAILRRVAEEDDGPGGLEVPVGFTSRGRDRSAPRTAGDRIVRIRRPNHATPPIAVPLAAHPQIGRCVLGLGRGGRKAAQPVEE